LLCLGNPHKSVRISCTGRNYNTEIKSSTAVEISFGPVVSWPTDWVAGRLAVWLTNTRPLAQAVCSRIGATDGRTGFILWQTNYMGSKII